MYVCKQWKLREHFYIMEIWLQLVPVNSTFDVKSLLKSMRRKTPFHIHFTQCIAIEWQISSIKVYYCHWIASKAILCSWFCGIPLFLLDFPRNVKHCCTACTGILEQFSSSDDKYANDENGLSSLKDRHSRQKFTLQNALNKLSLLLWILLFAWNNVIILFAEFAFEGYLSKIGDTKFTKN